ncbi:MAG: hypothetical protein O6933_10270, partial [Planctomycetota bacterium]|nr:hypothetical protein [Planctomycetota bacterium]
MAALGWPQAAIASAAAEAVETGRPILPGEVTCPYDLPPHINWLEQEKWAWSERICLGEVADMSMFRAGDGFGCDPEKADNWPETQDLSPEFLETILNHEPYRGALPRTGVRIRCARFNDMLDLSNMVIARPLWLDASRFRQTVSLTDLRSSSLISLDGSVFDGVLIADRLEVAGDLIMRGGAHFKDEFRLLGVKVGGILSAIGSTFDGLFNADRLEVAENLFMSGGAQFNEVRLLGAKVGWNLEAIGSTFDGLFNGDSLEVAGKLFMTKAHFKEVSLSGAKVGDNLETDGSTFDGLFNANRLEVAGDLFMRDGASFNDVNLIGAVIGKHLQLRDSDFDGHLDLTSVSIGEELHLTSPRAVKDRTRGDENYPPPRWSERARLTLRNAHVAALNDTEDAWGLQPNHLDLVGFTYDRLGGLRATRDSAMSARTTEWLRAWLAKQDGFDTYYNPQPFEQLAKVLRESGYPGKADAILFAARDHQRDSPATPWTSKVKLWLLWGLIGYGYHNGIALLWFAALTGLGAWVCGKSPFGRRLRAAQRFWYSFDMALPLIALNKRHEAVKLRGGVMVYFY